jgi:5-formyltetrahydrofolate cyclo-ligase
MNLHEDKARIRAEIRARRASRSDADRSAAGRSLARHGMAIIAELPSDAILTGYLSLPTEPDLDPLIVQASASGRAMWVPRIEGPDLAWVAFSPGDPVRSGPMGIREPLGPAVGSPSSAGVMFLPGLAVGRDGCRLGQGGGYYDRVLADVPPRDLGGPLLVIVLYADEIVDAVPAEPHDRRVDAALTPLGLLDF